MKLTFRPKAENGQLKYNLLKLLQELPSETEFKQAIKILGIACKVTEMGLRQWIEIPVESSREIPLSKLEIIAQFFSIPLSALKNYTTEPVDFDQVRRIVC
jgi:hypothetical protein